MSIRRARVAICDFEGHTRPRTIGYIYSLTGKILVRQVARRCAKPLILDEGITCLDDLLAAHNDGVISGAATNIKDGKASLGKDNNNVPAAVGRVAVSPIRGLEVGGSFHVGQYNVSSEEGVVIDDKHYLKIFGLDWEYRRDKKSVDSSPFSTTVASNGPEWHESS